MGRAVEFRHARARRSFVQIRKLPTDRMPAFLAAEEWGTWLGEGPATNDEVKACLKTVEGVNWRMEREQRTGQASEAEADRLRSRWVAVRVSGLGS